MTKVDGLTGVEAIDMANANPNAAFSILHLL
jgi:hypothetical protein